jgi:UDP-N-acetylmuramate dehydrogenase
MSVSSATLRRLSAITDAHVFKDVALSRYTRFDIGGPAHMLFDTGSEAAFVSALKVVAESPDARVVIGGGTNLAVADDGFDGIVLRYTGDRIERDGLVIHAQAGAVLQSVVDFSITHRLQGLQTMTGIPGYLGGAVYGNAGAYGRSIHEMAERVRFSADGEIRQFDNAQCEFRYRDSIFKAHKNWIILSATLRLTEGDAAALRQAADEIRAVRDAKYPPTMKCAGSIFKNLILADLPAHVQALIPAKVVREGKVPSAWFLEQAQAKGLRRGDIQVATYHANLIYNDGNGTAADLVWVINELKRRVREKFGFEIEEEVQYVGFATDAY